MIFALCTDNNYFQQACSVIRSIKHFHSTKIKLYFIGMDLSNENKCVLPDLESETLSIIYVEANAKKFDQFGIRSHVSLAAYMRLELPALLPKEKKVLYLDADLIVNGDLSEIWNAHLDGKALAAVENPFFSRHAGLHMNAESKYFNTGVALIDLDFFRRNAISEKAYEFVRNFESNMVFHDQDALNHSVDGNWLSLGKEYNLQTFFIRKYHCFNSIEKKEIKSAFQNPKIIHYSSGIKPWLAYDPHPLRKNFLRFYSGTLTYPNGIKETVWRVLRYGYTKCYYIWYFGRAAF